MKIWKARVNKLTLQFEENLLVLSKSEISLWQFKKKEILLVLSKVRVSLYQSKKKWSEYNPP